MMIADVHVVEVVMVNNERQGDRYTHMLKGRQNLPLFSLQLARGAAGIVIALRYHARFSTRAHTDLLLALG